MLSKLFRYNIRKCSRASPSIFYPLLFALLGMIASVEVCASISFKSLSAGTWHTCGVKTDGSLACWGYDSDDQATPPTGTFTQVSAGGSHSCGLKTDGSVACWGYNNNNQSSPPPSGTFTQVSAGGFHNCGLKTDGSVACWGDNSFGQVTPPTGTFIQLSASTFHNCGVKTDGSVACWGSEHYDQATPPFTQVSTGGSHTCGIKNDGSVACWGRDNYSQASPPSGTFTQVSSGASHTCGIKKDGNVACWGRDQSSQATPPSGTFTQVSTGDSHSCAIKKDGSVACWGSEHYDQATPPAIVSPTLGTKPLTVTLNAESVVGTSILNYEWYANDQSINAGNPASHTFTEHGEYVIKLVATHNDGSTSETQQDIRVMSPPVPKFTVIPSSTQKVNLDASGSYDPDGSILSYQWTVNGQKFVGQKAEVSIDSEDKITLIITDNDGLIASVNSTQESSYTLSVSKNGTGSGRITGQSIDCGSDCSDQYDAGTVVILTAKPDSHSRFEGWNGACPSTTTSCQVTLNKSKSVTATFNQDETPSSDEIHTLILSNSVKIAQLYGPTQAEQLMSKLNELAKHPDVQGLVIQVEDDSTVAHAYASRANHYDDKNKANAIVVSIKQLIRRHWDGLGKHLENIVLIGDDRVIPFFRLKDGLDPNIIYPPDPWILTDDFYTDRHPNECSTCANPLVFIPDIAGGRLIETPAQIIGMIDAFLANNHLKIENAAVTGYDFLQDSALSYCNTLQRLDIPSDCSLIGEGWTRDDFVNEILNKYHDIASINAHADYNLFVTPDKSSISALDFRQTTTDFAKTLFYTVGCHSGLNLPDQLDLPESMAIKQANYIANTGYGIGDLYGIGLSEELMWNLTKELVKSKTTLGKALLNAKQQYFADNPDFGAFDEKIVAESILYGLPMYQVTSSATAKLSPAITAIQTQTTEEQGLQKAGYSYKLTTTAPLATTSGNKFFSINGAISSSEGKPILPKLSYNVTQTQKALHGVVFKGGSYNTVNVTPPIQRFKTTTGQITPERTFNAPGWYPSIFFTPNTVLLDAEAKETLVATAGQYNPNLTTGQQRIFNNMDFDVLHHSNTNDWTQPTAYLTDNGLNVNTATVTITASDASGIKEVVLAYTDGNGTWNSTNLTGSDVTWTGSFAANANTEFFIQAVDKAGNVAVNDNEGKYFKVGQTPPPSIATVRLMARLINISTRASIQGGTNDVIAGFIITGTGTQKVIIRGLSLEAGVDSKLTVHQYPSGELLASNDNWQTDPRVGEIPAHLVLPNPIDAGVLLDLPVGAYTAILSSGGAKGLGLISVDEVEPNGTTKLINISTRASIGGGANDVIAGFIITGTGSQKVMIRGLALEAGVNPKLTLQKYPSGEPVASNDNWLTDSRASEIPEHLKLQSPTDAGLLLDLPVGAYTAILSSVGVKGLGLVGVDAID